MRERLIQLIADSPTSFQDGTADYLIANGVILIPKEVDTSNKSIVDCLKESIIRLYEEMSGIPSKTLEKFEKNIKDVEFTLGQTWEIQNALKKTLKEMEVISSGKSG